MSDLLIVTDTAPEVVEITQAALLVESLQSGDVTIVVESTDIVVIDGTDEALSVDPEPILNVSILTVSEQGPPGAGSAAIYQKELDFVNEDVTYRGDALPGTVTSAASWRVCRITAGAYGAAVIEYAEGSTGFDKVWDDRADYVYV